MESIDVWMELTTVWMALTSAWMEWIGVSMPFQKQMEEGFRSLRSEFEARIDAVRADIRRLDNIAELRERMASVEAKLAQRELTAMQQSAHSRFDEFEHEPILGVIYFPERLRARVVGIAQHVSSGSQAEPCLFDFTYLERFIYSMERIGVTRTGASFGAVID